MGRGRPLPSSQSAMATAAASQVRVCRPCDFVPLLLALLSGVHFFLSRITRGRGYRVLLRDLVGSGLYKWADWLKQEQS